VAINQIHFDKAAFLMESIIDSWGEDDQVVDAIVGNRFDEGISLTIWTHLVAQASPQSLFVDVGAYTGIYSLATASLRSDVKCVAFEPSTITFGRLAKNILLNGFDTRIIPVNLAAGAKTADMVFPHRYGIYSLCSGESSKSKEYDHTQRAFVVPLDDLLNADIRHPFLDSKSIPIRPFRRIAAMKIDVEGVEPQVLEGAQRLIIEHRPVIIAEYLSDQALRQLEDFSAACAYRLLRIPNERNIVMVANENKAELKIIEAALSRSSTISGRRFWTYSVPL
jgi:FkbM family methyltransferase